MITWDLYVKVSWSKSVALNGRTFPSPPDSQADDEGDTNFQIKAKSPSSLPPNSSRTSSGGKSMLRVLKPALTPETKLSWVRCCTVSLFRAFGRSWFLGWLWLGRAGLSPSFNHIGITCHQRSWSRGPVLWAPTRGSPVQRGFWWLRGAKLNFHGENWLRERLMVWQLLCSVCWGRGEGAVVLGVYVCVSLFIANRATPKVWFVDRNDKFLFKLLT